MFFFQIFENRIGSKTLYTYLQTSLLRKSLNFSQTLLNSRYYKIVLVYLYPTLLKTKM